MAKLFFCIAFLLFVASCYAQNKVVPVAQICKKSTNPSFCVSLLNSNPGAKDLVSLGQYTINVVRGKVTTTIALVKSLIAKGSDPKLKAHYKNCLDRFVSDLIDDVEDTQKSFKSGDYMGANIHASAVQTDVEDCISGEHPGSRPPHDPSLLPKYGGVIEQVADIILVISNLLRGAA